MNRIITIFAATAISIAMLAMPAKRDGIKRVMEDGSEIMVYLHGDENFHYMTLQDGTFVKENENGRIELAEQLSKDDIEKRIMDGKFRRARQITQKAIPLNIAPRGLIILVNFSDISMRPENTLEEFIEMHNSDNYTNNGATGSARQYFIDQSMGKYQPQFDVVGPITLDNASSYYGKNVGEDEPNAPQMIADACAKADEMFDIDFTIYDNDNDGEVDFVYVIYAGYGEADGGSSSTVWPHSYWLWQYHGQVAGGIELLLDGKRINTYACSSELDYTTKSLSGIGTFCHEFSHVLGLPDFYATNGASHNTLGSWDILDYGPYNNNGKTPPAYSAYERFFMGWLTPIILNTDAEVVLDELQSCNCAGIITETGESNRIGNDPNPVEFYMVENRQKTGWDKPLKGHGMMLTKIKYSYNKWYNNTVNNTESNMGVDLIEASGRSSSTGRASDLYPCGTTYKYATPYDSYPISEITETDGVIYFSFMNGGVKSGNTINISQLTVGVENNEIEDEEGEILAIYNTLGQVQAKDIKDLPRGMYIIRTTKGTKKISIK